jgi:peptide/nickel transport system substrate-binding protein
LEALVLTRSPFTRVAALAIGLIVTILPAATAQGDAAAQSGGELRIALPTEPVNLDPRLGTDSNSQYVQELVYSALLRIGGNLEPVPDLAESWENPSPERYVFHIREGVTFHDGQEVTAEDVKYTFDTVRDREFGSSFAANYSAVQEINVLDDHTVEFVLDTPFAPFLYYMNVGIVPQHLADGGNHNLQSDPVGSGPFLFTEWRRGESVILDANEDYYEGRPNLDRIVMVPIPETTVRLLELETGNVGIAIGIPNENIQQIRDNPDLAIAEGGAAAFHVMSFQNERAPFDDPRVRQALVHAVDKAGIVEHVYYGLFPVAHTPIVPTSWAHNADVSTYEYDPERAKELLAEAGVDPEKLSLTIHTWNRDAEVQIATIMQNQLQQIGIDADISVKEFAAFRDDVNAGEYDIMVMGFGRQTDPDSHLYTHFHSSQLPPAGVNRWRFSNERVDELLEAARTEMDQEVRKEMYLEIQQIVAEEVPYTPLQYTTIFLAYDADLQNVTYPTYLRLFDLAKNAYWAE